MYDALELFLLGARQHVLDRRDERRIAYDPQLAVDPATHLRERSHAVLRPHRCNVRLQALHLLA